jgi:3-oxoacyl-[acyl-carrier protein] reductase
MSSLNNKVAIVTGASKGIGAAIAKALAKAGAAVAVNYGSDKAGAEAVVEKIVTAGGRAVAIRADVSKATDVERLYTETEKALGAPSILINNAGVFEFGPVDSISEAQFHRHYDINVLGTILTIQQAVQRFPKDGGSIVNISSIASENPVPNSSLYSSSKGAIDTLTLALAKELGPRNIRVNIVSPGHTDTEGTQSIGLIGSEGGKTLISSTPLGARFARPEEIAPAVVFLASDAAAWLTGERLNASGGVH